MKGIKKLAGETKMLRGYSYEYIQVFYDKARDEIWGDYFVSLGQNSWNEYHDKNIVCCGNVCRPTTMKELRELVKEVIA